MFSDPKFHRSDAGKFLWYGTTADGARVGVIIATYNDKFNSYALNKPEFDRLLAAEEAGKVDETWVVDCLVNGPLTFVGERRASEVRAIVEHMSTRTGGLGEFWSRGSFTSDFDPF
jgi:hypothetical protein